MAGIRTTRPVRPWGKPPPTSSGGNTVGGFLNRNERSVQWTVATIEVAARSGIPPRDQFIIERTVTNPAEDRQWRGVFAGWTRAGGFDKMLARDS